jgi:hypothetical protein
MPVHMEMVEKSKGDKFKKELTKEILEKIWRLAKRSQQ